MKTDWVPKTFKYDEDFLFLVLMLFNNDSLAIFRPERVGKRWPGGERVMLSRRCFYVLIFRRCVDCVGAQAVPWNQDGTDGVG